MRGLILLAAIVGGCGMAPAVEVRPEREIAADAASLLSYVDDVKPTPAPPVKPEPGEKPAAEVSPAAILPASMVETLSRLLAEDARHEQPSTPPSPSPSKASRCGANGCNVEAQGVFRRGRWFFRW